MACRRRESKAAVNALRCLMEQDLCNSHPHCWMPFTLEAYCLLHQTPMCRVASTGLLQHTGEERTQAPFQHWNSQAVVLGHRWETHLLMHISLCLVQARNHANAGLGGTRSNHDKKLCPKRFLTLKLRMLHHPVYLAFFQSNGTLCIEQSGNH
eukprot:1829374-Amphidinium_carterae.1